MKNSHYVSRIITACNLFITLHREMYPDRDPISNAKLGGFKLYVDDNYVDKETKIITSNDPYAFFSFAGIEVTCRGGVNIMSDDYINGIDLDYWLDTVIELLEGKNVDKEMKPKDFQLKESRTIVKSVKVENPEHAAKSKILDDLLKRNVQFNNQ